MNLTERLSAFSGVVGRAATFAPDEYPEWSHGGFEDSRTDIFEMWPQIRGQISRDAALVPFIEEKLTEAFTAFDSGQKEKGRDALWSIYNLQLERLR